jgi:class 3 adenylate cyclase
LCLAALRSSLGSSSYERFAAGLVFVLLTLHTLATLLVLLRARLPRWATPHDDATAVGRALLLDWAANLLLVPVFFAAFLAQPSHRALNCPAASGSGECSLVFMRTVSLMRSFRTVAAQVPPRHAFAYEVARGALTAACGAAAYAADGALTPAAACCVLAGAAGTVVFSLSLVQLQHEAVFHDSFLPPWLDLWPAAWRPARDAALARLAAAVAVARPAPLDYRILSGLNLTGVTLSAALEPSVGPFGRMALSSRIVLHVYFTFSAASLVLSALSGGGALSLGSVAQRMGMDADAALVDEVRAAVAEAAAEADALRAAAAVLRRALFPHATALTLRVAAAAPGAPPLVHVCREGGGGGGEEEEEEEEEEEGETSRAFVAAQDTCMIADSRDFPDGLSTFTDWARAAAAGATTVITAPLPAGAAKTGTLVARFGGSSSHRLPPTRYEAVLMRCCSAIGEGVCVRRQVATASAASALASDIFPAHVVERLLERNRRESVGGLAAGQPIASGSRRVNSFSAQRTLSGGAGRAQVPAAAAAAAVLEQPLSAAAAPRGGDPASEALLRASCARRSSRLSQQNAASNDGDGDCGDVDFFSEDHACMSIVFIDVVNFTPLAESQAPAATMRTLHALFSRFDELCERLGVYKVETVGDEYMAAAGLLSLPRARQHAAAALLFALRAHDAARACGLRVRVGVHAGPVTSGLIGRLRARFCLFGDTVNTASRLEASGASGCVHASRAVWRLAGLPEEALPEARRVLLKGKAEGLDACLLDAASPAADEAAQLLHAQLHADEADADVMMLL